MTLSRNYTFDDIPTNCPFEYEGMTITKLLGGGMRVEGAAINILSLMFLGPKTDTGVERHIFNIDPTKTLASIGPVYLIRVADDEYYIEEYDSTGTVHYAQYFTTAEAAMRQFTKQALTSLAGYL